MYQGALAIKFLLGGRWFSAGIFSFFVMVIMPSLILNFVRLKSVPYSDSIIRGLGMNWLTLYSEESGIKSRGSLDFRIPLVQLFQWFCLISFYEEAGVYSRLSHAQGVHVVGQIRHVPV